MKKPLSILFVVVCLLRLVGCNINHEHTYGDYLVYESGHYHPYTCGCPQSEILEGHIDFDTNGNDDFWYSQEETPLDLNSLPDLTTPNDSFFNTNNNSMPELEFPNLDMDFDEEGK